MLKIGYNKRKNTKLFSSFKNDKRLNLTKSSNFNPLFSRFFALNESNYDSINLNHKWYLHDVCELDSDSDSDTNNDSDTIYESELITIIDCNIKNSSNNKKKVKEVFFKMAPLIDPYKYLIGKYDAKDENMLELPTYLTMSQSKDSTIYKKIHNTNNSSYVDGFFSYLSSNLHLHYNVINSIQYYGSYNAIKNDYKLNIYDDIELLNDSDFFMENHKKLYRIDNFEEFFEETDKKLKPIQIQKHNISLNSINSINDEMYDSLFEDGCQQPEQTFDLNDLKEMSMDINDLTTIDDSIEHDNKIKLEGHSGSDSGSSCSSRTSHTNTVSTQNSNEIDANNSPSKESNSNSASNSNTSQSYSEMSEEEIIAIIPKFPVHVVCMEACDDTFDDLILDEEMEVEEWYSALFQIIMILIVYQKAFSFTHNDLHTNNVMYNHTETKYIYYTYNDKTYRVPTFGKIFKIIDFGRSIYKFDNRIFCSDSFEKGGDADTQYNTEPFFNPSKTRIDPNMSFDLCRLGCSIFDYLVEDIDDVSSYLKTDNIDSMDNVRKLIIEWCLDDNGLNMLYKGNGEDRYPEFKLYKMIARCVHNHTPNAQLERAEFKQFLYKGPVKSLDMLTNIDEIPSHA